MLISLSSLSEVQPPYTIRLHKFISKHINLFNSSSSHIIPILDVDDPKIEAEIERILNV